MASSSAAPSAGSAPFSSSAPALLMAVEGLRAVQAACSEAITANAGDDGDRSTVLVCADVEQACLQVLGAGAPSVPSSSSSSSANPSSGPLAGLGAKMGGAITSLKSFRGVPGLRVGTPGPASDAAGSTPSTPGGPLGGGAEDSAPSSSSASSFASSPAPFLAQGITTHHLAPITDIIVLHEDDPMPAGFVKVSHSITGAYPADLNAVRVSSFIPSYCSSMQCWGRLLEHVGRGESRADRAICSLARGGQLSRTLPTKC